MSSAAQSGIQAIIQEPTNQQILKRFTRVAIATAVVPILAYFVTLSVSKQLHADLNDVHPLLSPPILSGLVAVITLNLITGSFALYAVHEAPNLNAPREAEEREEDLEAEAEEEEVDNRVESHRKEE